MLRQMRDEKGTVVAIAVVLLSVSLLLLAMVIDLGTVWLVKARVQTALDAATLAATSEAKVQVKTFFEPNYKTELFEKESQFPDSSLIVQKTKKTEDELIGYDVTYEASEGVIVTEFFSDASDYPDNVIHEEPVTKEVVVGYSVTYVESVDEVVESWALWLDEAFASDEAFAVMDTNLHPETDGGVVIKPITATATPLTTEVVSYSMEVEVQVPSKLLAPIMRLVSGSEGPRLFQFKVRSESRAFLNVTGE